MRSNEIRSRFLSFFEARGHRVVPSSSLVPANDPTLLFTNAGMNQFKDVFLGLEKRDYTRACSVQKCVRAGGKHNDLEQVGRTARHHTFFEMLGNFSFGDYFKKEAIPWAWELVTKDFAIPREKLYVTVFREDDEAAEIWAGDVGLPRDRIARLDEKDNFWAMGDTGPCGPCSEIHYDLGPAASDLGHPDCAFPCDCGRYVELWNLVFMQFNRDEHGVLTPLPKPCVDTGAGLERLAAVLQGKISNFDTDLFQPLIEEAASLAGLEYGAGGDTDVSLRIIADHSRAATFLISDGVLPSNEGRGYVLRLIMRRALYHGQTLGLSEPFLFKLSGKVVDLMKEAYPHLLETAHHVARAIKTEEDRYAHTTRLGLEQLNRAIVSVEQGPPLTFGEWVRERRGQRGGSGRIPGQELFKLHDTYGLRPDFVQSIVQNYGLAVDWDGYEAEMRRQRERARASWKGAEKKLALPVYQALAEKLGNLANTFDREHVTLEGCRILAIVQNGKTVERTAVGGRFEVILDRTPFYAEAGGQVGDTGRFLAGGEVVATVDDTYCPISGLIAHKVHWVAEPALGVGDSLTAQIDRERRDAIRRNHTATHLLHAALRHELGTHVKQAGSLVAPDRLRFDFTHYAALDAQDLLDIEDLVNEHVLRNEEVRTEVMDLDSALASGAMALFGEKYGDRVRVVSVDDGSFSKELCGGTHVQRTGEIGLFKLVSEGSVSAGTRRIEAVTGLAVLEHLRRASQTLALLSEALRAKPDELLEAAEKLAESEKKLRRQLEAQQLERAAAAAGDLLQQVKEVKGVRVLAARVDVTDRHAMRQMIDNLRGRLQSGVIVLGSAADGRVSLVAGVTKDLTSRLDAGRIVKAAAAIVEGSGGGRKDLAEAGGKNAAKLDESLAAVPGIVEGML
jgi:alanyl-tRNA synthetase